MAAPHPRCPGDSKRYEPGGLRVVDQDQVAVQLQALRLLPGPLGVDRAVLLRELLAMAVEGVVHLLRDAEETLVSLHDLPGRGDAELVQDDHDPVEDLRDAPAGLGGLHHDQPMAPALSRARLERAHPPRPADLGASLEPAARRREDLAHSVGSLGRRSLPAKRATTARASWRRAESGSSVRRRRRAGMRDRLQRPPISR